MADSLRDKFTGMMAEQVQALRVHPWQQGIGERCLPVDDTQAQLRCCEMSARMDKAIPLALRHPTLRDVLTECANATGLRFLFPERPYMDTTIPAFNMLGTGLEGLANIGGAFQIPDYIWQATGDGSVWLGSWEDSRWPSRPVELPRNVFRSVTADGGKSCPGPASCSTANG